MGAVMFRHTWTATLDNGTQLLVTVWVDEDGHHSLPTVATRNHPTHAWGPPTEMEVAR